MKTIYKIAAAVMTIAAISYLHIQNNSLSVSEYEYENEKVPLPFDGFRIAHVSDLHNKRFGRDGSELISLIMGRKPDIIVISGDLVDSRHTNIKYAAEFVSKACDIAPVYYVTGNHEHRFKDTEFENIIMCIENAGATALLNRTQAIILDNSKIYLTGANDGFLHSDNAFDSDGQILRSKLEAIMPANDGTLSMLIAHRPQFASDYAKAGADLTFSGHAHGGQFRVPFVGGFLAPDQGFFPAFCEGIHYFGESATVISRGLGNSLLPIRINNRPELVMVTLRVKRN